MGLHPFPITADPVRESFLLRTRVHASAVRRRNRVEDKKIGRTILESHVVIDGHTRIYLPPHFLLEPVIHVRRIGRVLRASKEVIPIISITSQLVTNDMTSRNIHSEIPEFLKSRRLNRWTCRAPAEELRRVRVTRLGTDRARHAVISACY